MVDQPGQRSEQARLSRPDLANKQHQLPRPHREVNTLHPQSAVVVHGGEPTQLQHFQAGDSGSLWRRRQAVNQVDTRGQVHEVGSARESTGGLLPGSHAWRFGDDRARDPAEPVEAVDGGGDEQCRGETPATLQEDQPAGDHAALDQHDRYPVEDRLDSVLEHGGVDPSAIDLPQMPVDGRGGSRQLDRAR